MSFKCSFKDCGKVFTQRKNQLRHEKIHSGAKPHMCPYDGCNKRFFRRCDMTSHYKCCHEREKQYQCEFPGCGKRFGRSSDLKVHKKRHMKKQNDVHKSDNDYKFNNYEFANQASAQVQQPNLIREDEGRNSCSTSRHDPGCPHAQPGGTIMLNVIPDQMYLPGDKERIHVHGAGCGHPVVLHEDHLDFLDSSGILHHQDGTGKLWPHKLGTEHNSVCGCGRNPPAKNLCPADPPGVGHLHDHGKSPHHVHGPQCGHQPVRHLDHLDYIVDGMLHSVHGDHCDVHGSLSSFLNDPGTSTSLDDLLQVI